MVTANTAWTPVIQTFDGVDMVLVPPGCFMMGSTSEQVDAAYQQCVEEAGTGACERTFFEIEQPAHEVCFTQPFWIDRTEVTNGQYAQFGGQAEESSFWLGADLPRETITWDEAHDFCALRGARLPTEAKWEYAARGPDGLPHPWGNTIDGSRANACDRNCPFPWSDSTVDDGFAFTAPAGSYPAGASWVGALDLSGNIAELVADWFDADYYAISPRDNPQGPESGIPLSRGSSFLMSPSYLRAALRVWGAGQEPMTGFRCARAFGETVSHVFPEPATPVPTAVVSAPVNILPVTRNSDWIPVIQIFDDVEMVLVPPGCFMMVSTLNQVEAALEQCEQVRGAGYCVRSWYEAELPAHEVCIHFPFWIDRTEVTNSQFAEFGGQAESESDWTDADRPRERITWFEARDFCARRGARLPTEAEWEYAARGPDGLTYPWGNTIDGSHANYCDRNCPFPSSNSTADDGYAFTAPAGSYLAGASWVGALDLSGNVWEWVSDPYHPLYYSFSPRDNPQGPPSGSRRVTRGGSWENGELNVRAAFRFGDRADERVSWIGFRCARSIGG